MRFLLLVIILNSFLFNYGQDIKICNKQLNLAFDKIQYYANNRDKTEFTDNYIENNNKKFGQLLLKYTASQPKTLFFAFNDLEKKQLQISTSKDGLFRIYSWNTELGGTMKIFKNVFQFKGIKKVYSQTLISDTAEDGNSDYRYEIIDQVISRKKTYYLVQCLFIGSTALSYHKIKIFNVTNNVLNENPKLIKTKTGMKNEVGYEIDLSSSVNANSEPVDMEFLQIQYDLKNKIITFPLISDDGKLTKSKIKYRFNGKYFEKL